MSVEEKNNALEVQLAEIEAEKAALAKELAEAKKGKATAAPALDMPTFKHNGKAYRFKFLRANIEGKDYVVAEWIEDKEFCKGVVEKYSGLVELV